MECKGEQLSIIKNGVPSERASTRGGTESAIRHHYDVSSAFYALWLGEALTYSCAMWGDDDDPEDLPAAQLRKIDYHLHSAGISRARHVLDVGCGWGSLLERALTYPQVTTATGLTLSEAQFLYFAARDIVGLKVR